MNLDEILGNAIDELSQEKMKEIHEISRKIIRVCENEKAHLAITAMAVIVGALIERSIEPESAYMSFELTVKTFRKIARELIKKDEEEAQE